MCTGIEIALVVGAVASAGAALAQAEAQAKAQEFNAKVQRQQARREEEIAKRDADEFGRSADRFVASQRAVFSSSGIAITGSALGVIEDTVATAKLEELNILAGGDARSAGLRTQAKFSNLNARNARTAGGVRAVTTLATGASQIFGGFGAQPLGATGGTGSFRFGGAGGQRPGGGF